MSVCAHSRSQRFEGKLRRPFVGEKGTFRWGLTPPSICQSEKSLIYTAEIGQARAVVNILV